METKQYLGIDIGGTTAKYAVISQHGGKSCAGSFSTGAAMTRREFLASLDAVVGKAMEKGISGIGVSTLGIINPQTGEVLGGVENMPALKNLNLAVELGGRFPHLPVAVYNDVKAAALGERWLGAAAGCDSFFCITMGTGLGGCAFLNGHLVDGAHHRAGEIGYLDYRSKTDYCEHHLSTGHVMGKAARQLGLDHINGFEFFDNIRRGDAACQAILDEWVERIARLVANIIILLDPEKIIIGGGVSAEEEHLLYPIRKRLAHMLPQGFVGQTEVVMARCGNEAGMLGAVSGFARKSPPANSREAQSLPIRSQ